MQRRSSHMVVKYSHVTLGDVVATRIEEGYFAGIVYQVGRIQFSQPDETGHRAMRFKYEILENEDDIEIGDDISPEGKVWIDPDNFNIWLKPKIGQCGSDGQFRVVKAADEHVAPDPMSIYPDRGVCKFDGLHAPDGTIKQDVL